jgi:hypothetical protein
MPLEVGYHVNDFETGQGFVANPLHLAVKDLFTNLPCPECIINGYQSFEGSLSEAWDMYLAASRVFHDQMNFLELERRYADPYANPMRPCLPTCHALTHEPSYLGL